MMSAALIAAAMSGSGGGPAPIGAPVLIGTTTSASATPATLDITTTADVPSGATLFVVAASQDSVTFGVTDVWGNTYTAETLVGPGGGAIQRYQIFRVQAGTTLTATSNAITVTFTGTAQRANVAAFYVAFGATPTLDFQTAAQDGTGDRTLTTPTLATAEEFVLVPVCVQSAAVGSTVTPPTGFTVLGTLEGVGSGGSNPRLHLNWKITAATTALLINPLLSDNTKGQTFAATAYRKP